jgi:hypothetical protein
MTTDHEPGVLDITEAARCLRQNLLPTVRAMQMQTDTALAVGALEAVLWWLEQCAEMGAAGTCDEGEGTEELNGRG